MTLRIVCLSALALVSVATGAAPPPQPLKLLPADSMLPGGGFVQSGLVQSVAAADLDGDGQAELVTTIEGSADLHVFDVTKGTLVEQWSRDAGVDAGLVRIADMNHDGLPDLLVADRYGDRVGVLINRRDPNQSSPWILSDIYAGSALDGVDVNGDGNPDVVSSFCAADCKSASYVYMALGDGLGGFGPTITHYLPVQAPLAFADLDKDGKADAVTAQCPGGDISAHIDCPLSVTILKGKGDGDFIRGATFPITPAATFGLNSVAIADLNGDENPDIVFTVDRGSSVPETVAGSVITLLGHGDGTFDRGLGGVGGGPDTIGSVATGDLNHDGKLDVAVASTGIGLPGTRILLGRGDGSFDSPVEISQPPFNLALGDVDGNGTLDLVSTEVSLWVTRNETGRCIVPNMIGTRLSRARAFLRAANCSLGRVKRAHSSHVPRGRVSRQSRTRGQDLPGGTRVVVTVSLGKLKSMLPSRRVVRHRR